MPDLSLNDDADGLIAAVAAANPRTADHVLERVEDLPTAGTTAAFPGDEERVVYGEKLQMPSPSR